MHLSVVIPNYNGVSLLPSCLASLQTQTSSDFETIVVDDCSKDGSLALLRSDYPWVKVVMMAKNSGFAAAANAGVRRAGGDVVVLINNDVELHPDFLQEIDTALSDNKEASFIAAKIMVHSGHRLIHAAGDFYRLDGTPGNRGVWREDRGQYDTPEYVFGACAAAAAYRRETLEDVAEDGRVFDESLFMYLEDVDLSFRAQLRGHKCLYWPKAIAYHRLSASAAGRLSGYYCGRNFLPVLLKNMPQPLLRCALPRFAISQARLSLELLSHFMESASRARLQGQLAAIGLIPSFLAKRRLIQQRRMVTGSYISSILST